MNIALQLYSLRDEVNGDFPALLEKVAKAGYKGVEFAGFHDMSADQLKTKLDELGLVSEGTHTGYEMIRDNLTEVIKFHKTLGTEYIIIPGFDAKSYDDLMDFANVCQKAGKEIEAAGMKFMYHNHSHEYTQIFNGKRTLDIMKDAIPTLNFQLDLYWVTHAGFDPVTEMTAYGNRCATVHLKDMLDMDSKKQTEVGNGILDVKKIIECSKKLGHTWVAVEQEEFDINPFDSIKISCDYIAKLL